MLLCYGVRKPIVVQSTGTDLTKFGMIDWNEVTHLRDNYDLKPENHVLISIGRLSKEKNLLEIIGFMEQIVKADPLARLLIVGDGPERGVLEQNVKEKLLTPYIVFTGEVKWKSIQNYYALGDVFVCASTSETQGLTYTEALASGKPLLVHEDACLKSILRYGVNGYTYQTEREFEQSYQELFDAEHYLAMERDVRESAMDSSSKEFGRKIEQIYQTMKYSEKHLEECEVYEKIHSVAG